MKEFRASFKNIFSIHVIFFYIKLHFLDSPCVPVG